LGLEKSTHVQLWFRGVQNSHFHQSIEYEYKYNVMVTDHSKVVKHYQRNRVRNYKKLISTLIIMILTMLSPRFVIMSVTDYTCDAHYNFIIYLSTPTVQYD